MHDFYSNYTSRIFNIKNIIAYQSGTSKHLCSKSIKRTKWHFFKPRPKLRFRRVIFFFWFSSTIDFSLRVKCIHVFPAHASCGFKRGGIFHFPLLSFFSMKFPSRFDIIRPVLLNITSRLFLFRMLAPCCWEQTSSARVLNLLVTTTDLFLYFVFEDPQS